VEWNFSKAPELFTGSPLGPDTAGDYLSPEGENEKEADFLYQEKKPIGRRWVPGIFWGPGLLRQMRITPKPKPIWTLQNSLLTGQMLKVMSKLMENFQGPNR